MPLRDKKIPRHERGRSLEPHHRVKCTPLGIRELYVDTRAEMVEMVG